MRPSRGRLDVREVVLGVAIHQSGAALQVGQRRAVGHIIRHLNRNTEELELALVPVGIAEPVGYNSLVAGTEALETVEVPVPTEHALGALEDLLSLFREQGVEDNNVVHGYSPFFVGTAGACAPALVGLVVSVVDGEVNLHVAQATAPAAVGCLCADFLPRSRIGRVSASRIGLQVILLGQLRGILLDGSAEGLADDGVLAAHDSHAAIVYTQRRSRGLAMGAEVLDSGEHRGAVIDGHVDVAGPALATTLDGGKGIAFGVSGVLDVIQCQLQHRQVGIDIPVGQEAAFEPLDFVLRHSKFSFHVRA